MKTQTLLCKYLEKDIVNSNYIILYKQINNSLCIYEILSLLLLLTTKN
jgi:hypothetical protein